MTKLTIQQLKQIRDFILYDSELELDDVKDAVDEHIDAIEEIKNRIAHIETVLRL